MIAAIATVETVSVFLMLVRWSLQLHRGVYARTYQWGTACHDVEVGAFIGHVVAGLLPPIALAFVIGRKLHSMEVRQREEQKRLDAELREAERALEGR